jgi:hypothetical protein
VHGPASIRVGVHHGFVVKPTVMKTIAAVGLMSTVLLMTGCSEAGDTNDAAPIITTTTTSTAAVSTPPSTTASTTTSLASSTESVPAPAPVFPSTTAAVVDTVDEPYVVECLDGTPGPARWSDGTWAFSQWCFDQRGGDEYLRQEREANTVECDGDVCRNPYTGGAYPDPQAQSQQSTADKQIAWCGAFGEHVGAQPPQSCSSTSARPIPYIEQTSQKQDRHTMLPIEPVAEASQHKVRW